MLAVLHGHGKNVDNGHLLNARAGGSWVSAHLIETPETPAPPAAVGANVTSSAGKV